MFTHRSSEIAMAEKKSRKDTPPEPGADTNGADEQSTGGVVEIRKYSNRRLYDTSSSRYITLAELGDMIRAGTDIRVRDAKTGQDLTRTVMLQIILESEQDMNMLPIPFLRKIIEASGEAVADSFRSTLVSTMELFTQLFEDFQHQMAQVSRLGAAFPPLAFQWMNYLNRYFQGGLGGTKSSKRSKEAKKKPPRGKASSKEKGRGEKG
jgi:polyhydroxyalkanoate synthesis repressor PhaR